MAKVKRIAFNPAGPFVARRFFFLGGVTYKAGDPFDGGKTSPRRLRQLYDNRKIDVSEAEVKKPAEEQSEEEVQAKKADPIPFESMSNNQIKAEAKRLTGVNYRSVKRAKEALCKLNS